MVCIARNTAGCEATQYVSLDEDRRFFVNDAEHPIGATWRTTGNGTGRATYRPDWSPSRPYALYWGGTARVHAVTLADASAWFKRNCRATLNTTDRK